MLSCLKSGILSKTIYYPIFDSDPNYANVVWVQNSNAVNSVFPSKQGFENY